MRPQWYFFLFFSLSLEFYISLRVGTERKYNFYFRSFSSFSNLFGCKKSHNGVFLFFEFFYNFFWIISYASCRNETKRLFLFSLFFGLFHPVLAWNEAVMVFLNFYNFFAIFFEFSNTRRVGTKRNDNFYFHFLSDFSNLFWFEKKS